MSARDARDIYQEIVSARQTVEKLPPGIKRDEDWVRRLHSIDPGHAPSDVKVAFSNYVEAMTEELEAIKNHQDALPFVRVSDQAAQDLTNAINRSQ